jgi:branched-chain amino acid transport system substrate-binding protein
MSRLSSVAALAVAMLLALTLLSACGDDDESSDGGNGGGGSGETASEEDGGGGAPIVIGVATAESGFQQVFDQPAVVAAEIAAEDIKAAGGMDGRDIRFIKCDVKSDPAQSADCAVRLISEGAELMIVSCDYDVGGPAARIAEEEGLISFSLCAGSPKWQTIGEHSYTMTFGSPTEGAIVAQWAQSGELSCKSAYLLIDTSIEYTKAVGDFIKEHFDGEIVGENTFKNDETSFETQVSQLQAANPTPDCIMLSSYPPGGATLLRQIRAAGIDQPVVSPAGMDGDYWIEAVPDLSDFYYTGFASIYGDDPRDKVNELVKEISNRMGEPLAGSTAVSGYSVMEAFDKAVTEAGSTDTEAMNEALLSFDEEPLTIGPTTFTPEDHMSLGRPMFMIQVEGGEFSYLETFEPEGVGNP